MLVPALLANFSGVVIDQNHPTETSLEVSSQVFYQTFRLPEDYKRGTKPIEEKLPGLSGFQILVTIPEGHASEAELAYTLEQYIFGSGWSPLISGRARGCHVDGERVWMDVLFEDEVPINESQIPDSQKPSAPTEFRIGFEALSHITAIWYSDPNVYPQGSAYRADGQTSIVATKSSWKEESWAERQAHTASFSFRVLGLIADSGIDFLGNPYRSLAITTRASNPAGENTNSGYWLSSPQPSRFAVVSHYSDLRPLPNTAIATDINRVENPNFEYDLPGAAPALWTTGGSYWTASGATTKVNRWRSQWAPEESYSKNEGVEREGINYVSITNNNRGHDPATDGGANWQTTNKFFEAAEGLQYLEVTTSGGFTKPSAGKFAQRFSARLFFEGILKSEGEESEGTTAISGEGVVLRDSIQVAVGKPQTFSVWARTLGPFFTMRLGFGDENVGSAQKEFAVTDEWARYSVTLTPTSTGETSVAVTTNGTRTFFIDAAMVNPGTEADAFFDGDDLDCKWENVKGRSGSIRFVERSPEENEAVVDSIFMDSITPGVAFNVYWSNDLYGHEEGYEPTIEEWERKLWHHVPKSYLTSLQSTYTLPSPVVAKFIKIEFSQLQARNYNPGDFQKPVGYRRFPDWISEIFLALLQSPNFIVKKVGVSYDALELAYNYYLNDLNQSPINPLAGQSQIGPLANIVDAATLTKINLLVNTFTQPPAARGKSSELLGATQKANSLKQESYPVEKEPRFEGQLNFPVSTEDRSAVVLDQQMPVMFFPITCRHEYKELFSEFENKRAYFAGLNEIAFIRHTYTTTSDGEFYIESGADDTNTERNDFIVTEGVWSV